MVGIVGWVVVTEKKKGMKVLAPYPVGKHVSDLFTIMNQITLFNHTMQPPHNIQII